MESAFQWLGKIFSFIWQFVPQPYITKVTEQTVLFRLGKYPILKRPGWHWHWPVTSPIETLAVVEQATEFHPAVLTTRDQKTVAVGFTLTFEIVDLVAALTQTDMVLQTIGELGEAAIASVIASRTFEELLAEIGNQGDAGEETLNDRLTQAVHDLVAHYGIQITSCRIGNFARCNVIRLMQNVM